MSGTSLPAFVEREARLDARNTLALPGFAAYYARIDAREQLEQLVGRLPPRAFVLGDGSNVVLQGDFDGLVLHMAISGRQLLGEDSEAWYVRAGAGENWHDFVGWTLAQGWPGLENLTLIPGTVGAAPIQNIGAYGLEVGERIDALTAIDMASGELRRFARAACRFAYRDSVFKQQGWHLDARLVIVEVVFRLPKAWRPLTTYADVAGELAARGLGNPDAHDIAAAVVAIRQRKLPDPAVLPNVGSFFQNPRVDASTVERLRARFAGLPCYAQPGGGFKLAAGWLIEQAGWKGRDLGAVGMYEKQALVLVNRGGATGEDVRVLMQAVMRDVREQFGVELKPEPVML